MASLRVLQVCVVPGSGGVEHHVRSLARGLDHELEVAVVATENGWLAGAASTDRLSVLTVPAPRGNFDMRTLLSLRRIFKDHRGWIIHSHLGRSDWYSWLASAGVPGVRLVTTEHGISTDCQDLYVRGILRWLHERMHALRLAHTDAVIAVAHSTAQTLRLRYPSMRVAPVVISPGVDTSALASIRRSAKAGVGPLRVVVVSRLAVEKGVDVALRGFALLLAQGVAARLTVVGDGPEEDALRSQAANLGCSSEIVFTGRVEDVSGYLRDADVFLMVSRSENLPVALLEAMASGLPCVATRVGGIPEVVGDSGAAILVQSEDVKAIACALGELAGNEARRAAMGVSAKKRAQSYDIRATVDAVVVVYASLPVRDRSR